MPLIATLAGRIRIVSTVLLLTVLVTIGYLGGGQRQGPDGTYSSLGAGTSAVNVAAMSPGELTPGEMTPGEMTPAGMTSVVASNQAAIAVFISINHARRIAGVPPLRWMTGLYRSALGHNFGMARTNQLSHQLAHEAAFGARITAQRVQWRSAGENIGWTSVQTPTGAVGINTAMLAERAPDDGHRRNILSTNFTAVGVNVVLDKTHNRLWVTEDFVSA